MSELNIQAPNIPIIKYYLQRVNITKFGNCDDVEDVKVNLTSVQYDYNDEGLCDTIHGKYYVHTIDSGLKYEVSNSIIPQH